MQIFLELTGIVLFATIISIAMKMLRQPLVIGYIFTGIFASSSFLNIIHSKDQIELFARIGIIILLFIVGLSLNPKVIRDVGKISLVAGLGQIIFTFALGYLLTTMLGMQLISALYIAIALTFSSTIIIMKLLSDRNDLNKVYGKVTVGVLLVQDIVAILILMGVSSFSGVNDTNIISMTSFIILKGVAIIYGLYLVSIYVLPAFSHFIASSRELLFLFSLGWGLGLSSIFYVLGFSIEIGALAAGVSLSALPFADGIASRMKPLRDFFIIMFFVSLGSDMRLDAVGTILIPALVLSLFVLIGKPIIVIMLMNLLGYKRKTAFRAGVSLAQVSEFSLIMMTLALGMGQLAKEEVSLVTLVGIITIAASSYLILYSDRIYPHVEKFIALLEFKKNNFELKSSENVHEVILFGFDRVGHDFIHAFSKLGTNYMVVDYNPALIEHMEKENIPYKFGDAEDVEFLRKLHFEKVKMVVSTIPEVKTSRLLLRYVLKKNPHAIVIMLAHDIESAKELYEHGATYVIMPHYLGAKHASDIIERHSFDMKDFEKEKERHLAYIEKRAER
jgi:Kef-type K+ transport system membrane component KefB